MAVETGYLALLHHHRRVLAEREFATLLRQPGGDVFLWGGLEQLPADPALDSARGRAVYRDGSQTWALLRFVLANVAGWALSPVVFVATAAARQDASGHDRPALARQPAKRPRNACGSSSFRTLAISAATTASVAGDRHGGSPTGRRHRLRRPPAQRVPACLRA